jgi:hypothetical protein
MIIPDKSCRVCYNNRRQCGAHFIPYKHQHRFDSMQLRSKHPKILRFSIQRQFQGKQKNPASAIRSTYRGIIFFIYLKVHKIISIQNSGDSSMHRVLIRAGSNSVISDGSLSLRFFNDGELSLTAQIIPCWIRLENHKELQVIRIWKEVTFVNCCTHL